VEISEIPAGSPEKKSHTILGTLSILEEGKKGLRHRTVLLIEDNSETANHPFRAIDPLTEEEVELTPTRLFDAYNQLDRPMPDSLKTNVGEYYKIRVEKKNQLVRKKTPKNTPSKH
jgi:hypothetical protein